MVLITVGFTPLLQFFIHEHPEENTSANAEQIVGASFEAGRPDRTPAQTESDARYVVKPASKEESKVPSVTQTENAPNGQKQETPKPLDGLIRGIDKLPPESIPVLTSILQNSENDDEIEYAASALARIGSVSAVTNLFSGLKKFTQPEFLENLAEIVSSITNKEAASVLIDNLTKSDSTAVKQAAMTALSRMADGIVVSGLVKAYEESDNAESRLTFRLAVGLISNSEASQALQALADSKTTASVPSSLRPFAFDALGRIGTESTTKFLLKQLEIAAPPDQSILINAISLIHGMDALPCLQESAINGGNEAARTAAILALGNYVSAANLHFLSERESASVSGQEARAIKLSIARIRAGSE